MTFREGFDDEGVSNEGAIEVFARTFVGGTRRVEAGEGDGRRALPNVGRGGGGMELKVGGFNRGGSVNLNEVAAGAG